MTETGAIVIARCDIWSADGSPVNLHEVPKKEMQHGQLHFAGMRAQLHRQQTPRSSPTVERASRLGACMSLSLGQWTSVKCHGNASADAMCQVP